MHINHISDLAQPEVFAPPCITATVSSYEYDERITIITFNNEGNSGAPRTLRRMVLLPAGVPVPSVLGMAPDIRTYPVFIDSVVERIFITLGTQPIGNRDVDVLTAVVDIVSLLEGPQRLHHGCFEFD